MGADVPLTSRESSRVEAVRRLFTDPTSPARIEMGLQRLPLACLNRVTRDSQSEFVPKKHGNVSEKQSAVSECLINFFTEAQEEAFHKIYKKCLIRLDPIRVASSQGPSGTPTI